MISVSLDAISMSIFAAKITTTERVLTEERQWLEVRHVRVEKNEGYLTCVQLVGKVARNFYFIWDNHDAVGI